MSSSASATSEALLILGASVRAATQSAQRAGFKTCGIDLFNDADLRKCGESAKVDDYGDLSQAILQFSPLPFVFTGGLENYSNLLSQISQRHQLLGCSPEVIRRVTDHQQLFVALQQHGFQVIPWSSSLPPHLPEQRWLSKPRKSCGGFNIHFAAETVKTEREPHGDSVYFQEYREGRVIGAVYIASGDFGEGEVSFVGATEQLNGVVDSPDQPFRYCGSAGPLELPRFMEHELSRLGRMLAKEFQLRGLFGVDVILGVDEFWVLEVNPRYTSSVEILERAMQRNLLGEHVAACRAEKPTTTTALGSTQSFRQVRPLFHEKQILYAASPGQIDSSFVTWYTEQNAESNWPVVADLPDIGYSFSAGQPICTLFSAGADASSCRDQMLEKKRQAAEVLGAYCC